MPNIEVCLSPVLFDDDKIHKKTVVVIDILRATTTINAALANGANAVIPVISPGECEEYDNVKNHILAAERKGDKVKGFSYGNSPLEYTQEVVKNKTLVLTTTNGTKAIRIAEDAKNLFIGSFTNINALCKHLKSMKQDIILFCSGWKDTPCLEDTIFAGACIDILDDFVLSNDSAILAYNSFKSYENNIFKAIQKCGHYDRLKTIVSEKELKYCATYDVINIVSEYKNGKIKIVS
jgi:2-phosphosulfolactate phosphatase